MTNRFIIQLGWISYYKQVHYSIGVGLVMTNRFIIQLGLD
jgi:hypothetical protein